MILDYHAFHFLYSKRKEPYKVSYSYFCCNLNFENVFILLQKCMPLAIMYVLKLYEKIKIKCII